MKRGIGLLLLCGVGAASPVVANDALVSATLFASEVLPGEPLFVRIAVRTKEPLLDPVDAPTAAKVQAKLHQRFSGRLFRGQDLVCEFPFFGSALVAANEQRTEFVGEFVGLLTQSDAQSRSLSLIASPGSYRLQVWSPDYPGGVSVPLAVREPRGREADAYAALAAVPVEELVRGLVDHECRVEPRAALSQIGSRYGDTVYGGLALAISALCDDRQYRGHAGGTDVQKEALLRDLKKASTVLPSGCPLRKEVLFRQATAEAKLNQYGAARRTIDLIEAEFKGQPRDKRIDRFIQEMEQAQGMQ